MKPTKISCSGGPVARPVCHRSVLPSHNDGRRLVLRVPDQPRLRAWLGKTRNQQGDAGYPVVRLTVLFETGTRGLLAAHFGPCAVGERAAATFLLSALGPQMLLLAPIAASTRTRSSARWQTPVPSTWSACVPPVVP